MSEELKNRPRFVFPNRGNVPLTYANFLNIFYSDGEFVLEFSLADIPFIQEAFRDGLETVPLEVKTRVVIPSNHFASMVEMIHMNHMGFMEQQRKKIADMIGSKKGEREPAPDAES